MKVPSICTFAVTFVAVGPTQCDAFLSLINMANPSINKYAEALENVLLKIHLDVGNVKGDSGTQRVGRRFGIDNLLLELHNKEAKYLVCHVKF